MDWFDCHAGFGVPAVARGGTFARAADLLQEMDFCGVPEALVHHVAAVAESPQVGNRLVLEDTEDEPRLHPTWAILPPHTGEMDPVHSLLAGMRERGVKVLRAYPDRHRYSLDGLTFGGLFEEMAARGIPLILPPDWARLSHLLAEFPKLTVIVVGHGSWGDDRYFRPLIERYERLHVDTSRYQLDHGIAAFVRKYGPDRMLYGSGSPDLQMGGALLTLAQADIDDAAKQAIAGANLSRLLGEVRL